MDEITGAMDPSNIQPASPKKSQTYLTVDGDDVKVKKNNSVPDFLWELDQDQHDLLMNHYSFIFKFAKYDGCYIPLHKENDIHPIVYYLRWVFLITVIALSSYQTLFMFFYVLFFADYSAKTALTIVELNWSFQSVLSIMFSLHWTHKNYFAELFRLTHKVNKSASHLESKSWIYFVFKFGLVLSVLVVVLSVVTVLSVQFDYCDYLLLDIKALSAYGPKLVTLQMVIFTYSYFVWIGAMSHYIIFTVMVYFESEYFNRQLATVGKNGREIGEELLEFYLKHCQMADVIYHLDRTFEVYTFAMIGSNIPTTIFSLLAFFMNLRVSWVAAVFTGPSVIVCIITLIGLTAVPAKLHRSITKIEKILYANKRIWSPYCEKTYQIAQVFITHVNQTDLGVSVWGFAVVSKPLILTTVSLTITYLSFLLQMKSSFVSNDGSSPPINDTVSLLF